MNFDEWWEAERPDWKRKEWPGGREWAKKAWEESKRQCRVTCIPEDAAGPGMRLRVEEGWRP